MRRKRNLCLCIYPITLRNPFADFILMCLKDVEVDSFTMLLQRGDLIQKFSYLLWAHAGIAYNLRHSWNFPDSRHNYACSPQYMHAEFSYRM